MKRTVLILTLVLAILTCILPLNSYKVNATTKNADMTKEELLKKQEYDGWYFNREKGGLQKYDKGDLIKNQFMVDNGKTYYFKDDGFAAISWLLLNNDWYYFDTNNIMQTGWIKDNEKWYYLNQNGVMLHDTTIDGYMIGSDGAWIK